MLWLVAADMYHIPPVASPAADAPREPPRLCLGRPQHEKWNCFAYFTTQVMYTEDRRVRATMCKRIVRSIDPYEERDPISGVHDCKITYVTDYVADNLPHGTAIKYLDAVDARIPYSHQFTMSNPLHTHIRETRAMQVMSDSIDEMSMYHKRVSGSLDAFIGSVAFPLDEKRLD